MTATMLPSPPQTQARHSSTFQPPALDGSLTLLQMYDWHLEHSPNHRLFVYSYPDGSNHEIYWPEGVAAIYTGARIMKDHIQISMDSTHSSIPIVAILAPADTITYFTVLMSILRANLIPFPISPRNSAVAVAHLLNAVQVQHILVGHDKAMQDLAENALNILKSKYSPTFIPQSSLMPHFEDLFIPMSREELDSARNTLSTKHNNGGDTAMYLHSSGSTAFPKPIPWTFQRLNELCLIPWFGEQDLTDQVFSLHTMPMYHGMGVLQLCWTASCGLVVAAFEPKSPATLPTPDNLFEAAKATKSDIIFCVPSIIEAWSRQPAYIKWLSTRTGVLFGGGPLNKEAGDYMTSQGVSIFILYGSTEGGIMSPVLPKSVGYDWDYFRFADLVKPEMIPSDNNSFELHMVSNPFCTPSVINTKVRGVDAYATSDLLVAHPTKPGYWKIFGRTDDQIMHSTGEKTNPGPLENILNQDPHVAASVMFGRGYFQAGVLVEPKPEFSFDPADQEQLSQFWNSIWPTVEKMNNYAPQHSRLFKEMILVAKPTKPFTYTAKNTARRQAILDHYNEEIALLYATVEESTQSNIPAPLEWDLMSTTSFVQAVITSVMNAHIQDEDDIFQFGCDSLQATWIRNTILRALREAAEVDSRHFMHNFVYDHPSISQLSQFLFSAASQGVQGVKDQGTKESVMMDMVEKYSQEFPTVATTQSLRDSAGMTVVLTGSTGGFGTHLLAALIRSPQVSKIYALNRAQTIDLQSRQKQVFAERGEDLSLLSSKKVVLLEVDLLKANCGLSSEIYNEIKAAATHVIHNAWRVDFNLSLSSFESNIKGLRNLIDFTMTTGSRLVFISSVGVFQNLPDSASLDEVFIQASTAVNTGYTESKWVSEDVLRRASLHGLDMLIVRVGQLCGGPNGSWNIKEWVPSMIQSSVVLGCIPTDNRTISWIPPHVAASAVTDFLLADSDIQVVHLAHPKPIRWEICVNALAKDLKGEIVSFEVWLRKLEQLTQTTPEKVKSMFALRILPFYREMLSHGESDKRYEAFGLPKLEIRQATSLSSTLLNPKLAELQVEDVLRWTDYWRKHGKDIFQ